MRTVGIVEMLVGIGILSPRTRIASYAAAAWLLAIAGNLWLNDDYDVVKPESGISSPLSWFGFFDSKAQAQSLQFTSLATYW